MRVCLHAVRIWKDIESGRYKERVTESETVRETRSFHMAAILPDTAKTQIMDLCLNSLLNFNADSGVGQFFASASVVHG